MISKMCHYHIVRVTDLDSESSPLESVHVVKDFLEIFHDDMPRIPAEYEEFIIDLTPYTNPISIHSYRMALVKMK